MAKSLNIKVITPTFRVSFPHIFKPQLNDASGKMEYSIAMLFDKSEDLSALKKAIMDVSRDKWPSGIPKGVLSPFKNGDDKEYDGYAGMIYATAKSKTPVSVLNNLKDEITDENEFYAGCYARASIQVYAWEHIKDNKVLRRGVSFSLNHLQKMRDGEPFGKRKGAAEDDFESFELAEDDFSNVEPNDFPF